MEENKIIAAILTFALWNRAKASGSQVSGDDWRLVVEDYTKIVGELYGMDRSSTTGH
jgi:hydrogenase maturation factor